jgi:hypothetical protein|tara:strand:- start:2890 stop:3300 length:411 start_codon:yes stop_codon:yes gene_type:complete
MTRRLAIYTLLAVGVCVASVGCASIKSVLGASKNPKQQPSVRKPTGQPPLTKPDETVQQPKPFGGQGKVMLVDRELGFIVVDFTFSQLPPAEQKYYVYRGNQQVGEIITTGQVDETFLVADINKGDIRAGDLVRPE